MKSLILPFSHDVNTAIRRTWHQDCDGNVTVDTAQDVEDILDVTKSEYNSTDERAPWSEFDRVASIPLVLYFKLKREGITDDPVRFKKWLNDSDNRHFRIRPGRL